jgi:hypothetical protein
MGLEQLADLGHRRPHVVTPVEVADERPQPLVVDQGLDEERTRFVDVGDEREQLLLLGAEVPRRLGGEERPEGRDGAGGIGIPLGRLPQPAGGDESVMVVVRERDQGGVALHAVTVAGTRLDGVACPLGLRPGPTSCGVAGHRGGSAATPFVSGEQCTGEGE